MAKGGGDSLLGRVVVGIRSEVVEGSGEGEVVVDEDVEDMDCAGLELGLGCCANSEGHSLRRSPGGLSSARGEETRERDGETRLAVGIKGWPAEVPLVEVVMLWVRNVAARQGDGCAGRSVEAGGGLFWKYRRVGASWGRL